MRAQEKEQTIAPSRSARGCVRAPRARVSGGHLGRAISAAVLLLLAPVTSGCGDQSTPTPPPDVPVGTAVGDRAPPITGTAADGRVFSLAPDGRMATVLVFYRSYDCGLCRQRLRELQAHLSEYDQNRANVVVLSADSATLVRHAVEELGLTFPVVAADSAALHDWNVVDDGTSLPRPASYLLDREGFVVYRHVGRNAADRASDLELLAALQQLHHNGR